MVQLITVSDIQALIQNIGIKNFYLKLIDTLDSDFSRWDEFTKSPRHATYVKNGVIELMPISDQALYSFKYVNGHPTNPSKNKSTVVAFGVLADVETGYPLLISEMTLLTAFRTAATSALAAKYLARQDAKRFGIVGTGAQSEFQAMAFASVFDLDEVHYFDIDEQAMQKFEHNLSTESFKLIPARSVGSVIQNVDIITTATANQKHAALISKKNVAPGLHINGIGGDSPGKTEIEKALLPELKIVVEYLPQSEHEGEIQQCHGHVYAELWEIVSKQKPGRVSQAEITLFDSVGFALEDFSILRCVAELANQQGLGRSVDLLPSLTNPKNLFGAIARL